jgi:hypothetical protein
MSESLLKRWGATTLAGLLFALPATADEVPAEAEPGAPTSVNIRLQVIEGSSSPGEVDPRLEKVRKRLTDFRFASLRLASEKQLKLGLRTREVVALPGDRALEVTPRKFERGGKLRVHLHLKSPANAKLIDADYAIEPGGDLLVGGLASGQEKLLLLLHHGE